MDFMKKYPLSVREAVFTPLVFRDGFGMDNALPYPSLKGIRDFACYCGISDNAVRTSLSRAHSEGEISIFKDSGKVTRYQLAESQLVMGKATGDRLNRPDGFIIAVFSFTRDDVTERSRVRETLKYYGFKKLAQNTYINGRIETESLKKAMREFGLEKNLYLFNCPNIDDSELIEKILSVFEIEKRNRFLKEFRKDLTFFLTEKKLDADEIIHRIYYSGPVHWTICYVDEPPFPLKHLPADYPLNDIIQFFAEFSGRYRKKFIDHYLKVNG